MGEGEVSEGGARGNSRVWEGGVDRMVRFIAHFYPILTVRAGDVDPIARSGGPFVE